jgi:hypothetical protein
MDTNVYLRNIFCDGLTISQNSKKYFDVLFPNLHYSEDDYTASDR